MLNHYDRTAQKAKYRGEVLKNSESKNVKKLIINALVLLKFLKLVRMSGVEFTNATVQVDFKEIEEGKKSAVKWRQWREEKNHVKTKAS